MSIHGFRVALTTNNFESVLTFFRDGLGLKVGDLWTEEDGGQGQLFFAGQASLEVFNPEYAKHVDVLEVGKQVSGQIRFAFEVSDVQATVDRALNFGAILIHKPKLTPWGDLNARLQSPDGLQVTVYQSMSSDKNSHQE